MYMRY